MKLMCGKETLLNFINIVNKAVSSRTTLPILECILLTADQRGFTMTANNLELGIQTAPIDADVLEKGEIAIEAKIFHEIIRRLNGDTVTLETASPSLAVLPVLPLWVRAAMIFPHCLMWHRKKLILWDRMNCVI